MKQKPIITSQVYVKLNGEPLSPELLERLVAVTVDQHVHLPAAFTIRLHDTGLELLDEGPFDLTQRIEISGETPDGRSHTLIAGEITALEPAFAEGMTAELVLRGFDQAHRLYRQTKSRTFINHKDSDIARKMAGEAGLRADVEDTAIVYNHLFQENQSDLAFLQQRAQRIGYECYVTENSLVFRAPRQDEDSATLTWGDDLVTFHPSITLAEQVAEVQVRGWDPAAQRPILGKAVQKNGRLYPQTPAADDVGLQTDALGAGKEVWVDWPVVSQAEADLLAAARLDTLSGAYLTAEGEAFRRPDVKAGRLVKLKALGKRLSGSYLVTRVTHTYTAAGLRAYFHVQGSRNGMLSELLRPERPSSRWAGVVTAVVTNTDDPQQWGRVKLKFPWLSDDAESDWARVMGAGGGPQAGFSATPGVGHEVLVAFELGDFGRPVVLGGVWNGQHALPPAVASAGQGEKPQVRCWRSLSGHHITMHDNADNKITVQTAAGHQLLLDDANKRITITSSGGLTLTLDDNDQAITIEATGPVQLKAGGDMALTAGGSLALEAGKEVNVKGSKINLN